jgi:hypothetical protein
MANSIFWRFCSASSSAIDRVATDISPALPNVGH